MAEGESSSFVLAPDSSSNPGSMVNRGGEAPLKFGSNGSNEITALEAPDAIRNESTGEEANEDQLMQGLGQITAPIEM